MASLDTAEDTVPEVADTESRHTCKTCGKLFDSKKKLYVHNKTHVLKWCFMCEKEFNGQNFSRHQARCRKKNGGNGRTRGKGAKKAAEEESKKKDIAAMKVAPKKRGQKAAAVVAPNKEEEETEEKPVAKRGRKAVASVEEKREEEEAPELAVPEPEVSSSTR